MSVDRKSWSLIGIQSAQLITEAFHGPNNLQISVVLCLLLLSEFRFAIRLPSDFEVQQNLVTNK